MKFVLLLVLLLSISLYSNAQITYQKTIGGIEDDRGYSIQQTSDSGYVIVGTTFSFGASTFDIYLLKIAANGNSSWRKTYGGPDNDAGTSVIQTADGGFAITGYTASFGAGDFDIFLIKTNAYGDTLWARTFGGNNSDEGYSIQQTTDGGYIIVGFSLSFGFGPEVIYLAKTDANGNLIWDRGYSGVGDNYAYSVKQTSDNGYIIVGSSWYQGQTDVLLIKTNDNGDTLWTKTYGGAGIDKGRSIQITSDGGYIITGYSEFGNANFDLYLIKTDLFGNLIWSKTYGGTSDDIGDDVHQTLDGGYIVVGYSRTGTDGPDIFLVRTDINGDTLWTKRLGGDDFDLGYSVQETFDGCFIVTGLTKSFGVGDYDVYIIKTDQFGNSQCNKKNTTTIVNSPPTQTNRPAMQFTNPNAIVTEPHSLIGIGGIDSMLCSSIGIDEAIIENSNFLIFPNPASSTFTAHSSSPIQISRIEIHNLLGEKIYSAADYLPTTIDCRLFPPGIYFVSLQTEKGITVQKLVKQ